MTIHISTSKAHSGKDLKIIAYNDHNYKTAYTFVHQVYGTENGYECTPIGANGGSAATGGLSKCVAYAFILLARHIASPSPSKQIRAEVEAQATANKELHWNPNTAD